MSGKYSMTYRIAVTGVDGTGRTTLAQALSKEFDIPCVEDQTRSRVHSLGYQTIYELPDSVAVRIKLFNDLVCRHAEMPAFVSDSSVIDWFAQWQRWEWNHVAPAQSEALYQQAKESAATYTHVIFLQPSFQPPYDGFRWLEPNHRAQVTRLIRVLIAEWGLSDLTLELATSSAAEAAQQAMAFVRGKDTL